MGTSLTKPCQLHFILNSGAPDKNWSIGLSLINIMHKRIKLKKDDCRTPVEQELGIFLIYFTHLHVKIIFVHFFLLHTAMYPVQST